MADHRSRFETLILDVLQSTREPLTMDEILARLPELKWSEVFLTVDALSRRGDILIQRKGFDYELRCGSH
jgi:hypothetical protein